MDVIITFLYFDVPTKRLAPQLRNFILIRIV